MALWGDGNLVRLLRAGTAHIQPARAEGPTCGLVPLARPATASSTGLKWDLDNTHVSRLLGAIWLVISSREERQWTFAVVSALVIAAHADALTAALLCCWVPPMLSHASP